MKVVNYHQMLHNLVYHTKNIQHVVQHVLQPVMIYVILCLNHRKLALLYVDQVASAKQVIIFRMLENVFHLNNVVEPMNDIQHVVQLVLKRAMANLNSAQNNVLSVVSVAVRIMFVRAIVQVALAFIVMIARQNVLMMNNDNTFFILNYFNKILNNKEK